MPFTVEQFLNVFRDYNQAIWPAQILAYLLGIAGVILAIRKMRHADKLISGILGIFWLWMGVMYHLTFFSAINKAAYGFGTLFILQGFLFLAFGVIKPRLSFGYRADGYGLAGGLLILYAMFIYPILGYLLGHGYPFAPMFGAAPCPTTIFTFGLLLWTGSRVPQSLLVIPGLWSLIGFSAAVNLGIIEDFGLVIAGLLGVGLLLYRDRKKEAALATP